MDNSTHPFINPFTDFGFKRLFGSKDHSDLLIDFLNTMLPEHHHIQEICLRKTEELRNTSVDRKSVFYLYCRANSGEQFIVEIHRPSQDYYHERFVLCAFFPTKYETHTGVREFQIYPIPVYRVILVDFLIDHEEESANQYFHIVKLVDSETNEVFTNKLILMILEIQKFEKTEDQLNSHFEKWLYALKHMPNLHQRPAKLEEHIFTRLFETVNIAQLSQSERAEYENSLKVSRDMQSSPDVTF